MEKGLLIKRITIDIDSKDLLYYHRAKAIIVLTFYNYKEIKIRHSASGKHYHVIAWHTEGHDIIEHLKIRELAGDDKARIYFDSQKNRTINILFSQKEVIIFKNKKELKQKLKVKQ